jgi:hypothetical protein
MNQSRAKKIRKMVYRGKTKEEKVTEYKAIQKNKGVQLLCTGLREIYKKLKKSTRRNYGR